VVLSRFEGVLRLVVELRGSEEISVSGKRRQGNVSVSRWMMKSGRVWCLGGHRTRSVGTGGGGDATTGYLSYTQDRLQDEQGERVRNNCVRREKVTRGLR